MSMKTLRIFANVAGEDVKHLDKIAQHLKGADNVIGAKLVLSDERACPVGCVRTEWVGKAVQSADLMLVMFSGEFFNSSEHTALLAQFLERAKPGVKGGGPLRIIPVVASACVWDIHYGSLQVLPSKTDSLEDFADNAQKKELVKIARELMLRAQQVLDGQL